MEFLTLIKDVSQVLLVPLVFYIAKTLTDIKVKLAVHETEINNLKSK